MDNQTDTQWNFSAIARFKGLFRSPLINVLVLTGVILLGGFMTYNFVVHQLTQLAGESTTKVITPTPQAAPTALQYNHN